MRRPIQLKFRCLATTREYVGNGRVRHKAELLIEQDVENVGVTPIADGRLTLSNLVEPLIEGQIYQLTLTLGPAQAKRGPTRCREDVTA